MKRKIFMLIAALAVIAIGTWLLTHRGHETLVVSGTVEADEAHVGSRFGGRVKSLLAKEGAWVGARQEIVQLDAADLRARYDQVNGLLVELENGPRPQEIAAAKHDWEALTEDYKFAQEDAKRKKEMYDQKVISVTDLDQAMSLERSLKQRVEAAQQRYDLLAAGTRPEKIVQVKAQLAELDAQITDMLVVSPADATLETIHVKPGDIVPPNGVVATILFQKDRWVRVYVPETWLGRIKEGQTVALRSDAYTDRQFTGTVAQINRKAEFTPRNVQTAEERVKQVFGVKVTIQGDDQFLLRPGMSVDVTFPEKPPSG